MKKIHSLVNCLGACDAFPVENEIKLCPDCFEWIKTEKTFDKSLNKYEYTQIIIDPANEVGTKWKLKRRDEDGYETCNNF